MAGTRRSLARCVQKCLRRSNGNGSVRAFCSSEAEAEKRSNLDLGTYWASVTAAVNMALDKVVPVCYPEKIHESMRYSLFSAGRRMPCGLLCAAACEAAGGRRAAALPVACAVEMVQAATLAHDDLPCMDNVAAHGGDAANHAVYGEDVAILAGDALFGLAFQHIVESSSTSAGALPVDKALKVLSELARGIGSMGLVGGQYMDLIAAGNSTVDPALLEYIHHHKSALMAEISVAGGAVAGGGSEDEVERLRGYGRSVGLLYQIVEDMLHVGTTCEGRERATYPKVHGLERSKQITGDLNYKAKEYLSSFEEKLAAPLLSFADYAATRSY